MRDRPESLTINQASQLIDKLKESTKTKSSRLKAIRDTTIAMIMLDAGLRCGEVVACDIEDLSFNGTPVTHIVLTDRIAKKAGARTIPVSPRLQAQIVLMLMSWWKGPLPDPSTPAFQTRPGGKRITVRAVQKIIGRASMSIFQMRINPHMLRHTFASNLMRKANIRVVQTLLGHRCISSTQIYTHPDAEDLKQAISNLPS